jgi:hypothetical protein
MCLKQNSGEKYKHRSGITHCYQMRTIQRNLHQIINISKLKTKKEKRNFRKFSDKFYIDILSCHLRKI